MAQAGERKKRLAVGGELLVLKRAQSLAGFGSRLPSDQQLVTGAVDANAPQLVRCAERGAVAAIVLVGAFGSWLCRARIDHPLLIGRDDGLAVALLAGERFAVVAREQHDVAVLHGDA